MGGSFVYIGYGDDNYLSKMAMLTLVNKLTHMDLILLINVKVLTIRFNI